MKENEDLQSVISIISAEAIKDQECESYPAIGLKQYIDAKNKVLHRTDGPDIEWFGNTHRNKYYLNGKEMTKEMFVCWYEVAFLKEYTGL